jgi:hypothetical protein
VLRHVAVILTVLAVLLQGAGAAFRPTNVVYLEPHAHDDGEHDHGLADPHHAPGDLTDPFHEHEEETPDHVHVSKPDTTPSQPRSSGLEVQKLVVVFVAIMLSPEYDLRPSSEGPRWRPPDRWSVGPPPSIRTTRLLI